MKKSIHTIYKITNIINQKIYIGVHKTSNPTDDYFGSGNKIKQAILKYGKENFTKSILFEYDNSEDAYLKESQIVNQSFVKSKNTYNIAIGGNGGNTGNYLPKHGKLNPMFGKKHSIETKKLFSEQRKGKQKSPFTQSHKENLSKSLIGKKRPRTKEHQDKISKSLQGRIFTKSTKDKISKSKKGKLNPKFKGYYITPLGKFESLSQASKSLKISKSSITNLCNNPTKIITKLSLKRNQYLQSLKESPIGKTFKDLGFEFLSF